MAQAASRGTDYRTLFEKDWLGAWDLQERDITVTIERVGVEEVTGEGGRKERCAVIRMKGKKKGLIMNITNGGTIAAMYGKKIEEWPGKKITLYGTTCQFGKKVVDCIRVREGIPGGGEEPPHDPETGEVLEPNGNGQGSLSDRLG